MFLEFSELSNPTSCDICVVGAGPVGIAVAMACEDSGSNVLLLESGGLTPDKFSADLSAGHHVDLARHASPTVSICRVLGGTSRWWGGRCVPFDEIDFQQRPLVGTDWPLGPDDLDTWYAAAAEFLGLGPPRFSSAPHYTPNMEGVRFDQLERWAPEIDLGKKYRGRLERSEKVNVVLRSTVVDLSLSQDTQRVESILIAGHEGRKTILPKAVVLACGGLETTRLMLSVQRSWTKSFGGIGGPLGRGYMGHLSGKISNVVLDDPQSVSDHDFFLDDGAYARRRFTLTGKTQLQEHLSNIAFWIDNPPFYAPEHGNGILSLAWLALATPWLGRRLASEGIRISHLGTERTIWWQHASNVLSSPVGTLLGILTILKARFVARPRKPGFLVLNRGGGYALHFHAEHLPNEKSQVTLSDQRDTLGLPYLNVTLLFSERDAESVVRAHEVLDEALRKSGVGRLEYKSANRSERIADVISQATDGFHQIGTTRMSRFPSDGVVNQDCRVHDVVNLWIGGSSVFTSSGQANPTLLAVALALRLGKHLSTWCSSPEHGSVRAGN